MADERNLGADAVRAMAAFDDASIPSFLLTSYPKLKEPAREATVITLASRPAWRGNYWPPWLPGSSTVGRCRRFKCDKWLPFPMTKYAAR